MKKLILISALLLSGCDSIKDIRLLCDCNFQRIDGEKRDCYSVRGDVNNKSLVINDLKKTFIWDGQYQSYTVWNKNIIKHRIQSGVDFKEHRLDRVNLAFTYSYRLKSMSSVHTTSYLCRVVDGV